MRELDFPLRRQGRSVAQPYRAGRPFSNPVKTKHRCFLKRAGIKGGCRMLTVVLMKQERR